MARYLYQCPEVGCWYSLLLWEHESREHACPHGGDTHIGLSVTMTLVEECWKDLDAIMDQIMSGAGKAENPGLGQSIWKTTDDHIKHERLKGQARGMSALLARFMVPFFRTPDEIAKEAKRRWEHRQRGETYETPGLGQRKFEFPSDDKYKGIKEAPLATRTEPRVVAARKSLSRAARPALSEKEIAGIKGAQGLMTAEELASIYRTSAQVIRGIWA